MLRFNTLLEQAHLDPKNTSKRSFGSIGVTERNRRHRAKRTNSQNRGLVGLQRTIRARVQRNPQYQSAHAGPD